MDVASALETFIVEELMVGNQGQRLDHNASLVASGVIDSLSLLRLVAFIEEKFGVMVEDDEVVLDNFESINIMTAYVDSKLNSKN